MSETDEGEERASTIAVDGDAGSSTDTPRKTASPSWKVQASEAASALEPSQAAAPTAEPTTSSSDRPPLSPPAAPPSSSQHPDPAPAPSSTQQQHRAGPDPPDWLAPSHHSPRLSAASCHSPASAPSFHPAACTPLPSLPPEPPAVVASPSPAPLQPATAAETVAGVTHPSTLLPLPDPAAPCSPPPPAVAGRGAQPGSEQAGPVQPPPRASRLPVPKGVRGSPLPPGSASPDAPAAAAAAANRNGVSGHTSPHRSPPRREAAAPRVGPQLQGPTAEERALRRARFAERRLKEEARLKAQAARAATAEAARKAAEEARVEARRAALRERVARHHQAVAAEAAERAAAEGRARQEVLRFRGKPLHLKLQEERLKLQQAEEQERQARHKGAQRKEKPSQPSPGEVAMKSEVPPAAAAAAAPAAPLQPQASGAARTSPHRRRSPGLTRPEPRHRSGTGEEHRHHRRHATQHSAHAEAETVAEEVDGPSQPAGAAAQAPANHAVRHGEVHDPNRDKLRTKGVVLYSTRIKGDGPPVPPLPPLPPPPPPVKVVGRAQSPASSPEMPRTQPSGQPLLATAHSGPLQPSLRSHRHSGVGTPAEDRPSNQGAALGLEVLTTDVAIAAMAHAAHDDDFVVLASGPGSQDGTAIEVAPHDASACDVQALAAMGAEQGGEEAAAIAEGGPSVDRAQAPASPKEATTAAEADQGDGVSAEMVRDRADVGSEVAIEEKADVELASDYASEPDEGANHTEHDAATVVTVDAPQSNASSTVGVEEAADGDGKVEPGSGPDQIVGLDSAVNEEAAYAESGSAAEAESDEELERPEAEGVGAAATLAGAAGTAGDGDGGESGRRSRGNNS